jgi:hypothetical protein
MADGVKFDSLPRGESERNSDPVVAEDGRLSTPHPKSSSSRPHNFHFQDKIDLEEETDDNNHESCIGISLHTVISTLRGENDDVQVSARNKVQQRERGFFPSIKAIFRQTLLPLNWSDYRTPRTPREDTLEDYDLINRLPSWKTLETPSVYRTRQGATPKRSSKQVQFQYPPITSIHLRPRTESDEIDRLYFAPDELDQIEDDRSDTKAADDIETLCVIANPSEDMESVPGVTESLDSPSDELDSSVFSFISGRKKSSSPGSSSTENKKKTRIVRGVQILLREKSLG